MYLVQFGLFAIIAILVTAAPQAQHDYYPEYLPYESSTPTEYQDPDHASHLPIPEESGSNHHDDGFSGTDDEHKDFNVIVGFFNGINETNNLESIARNIQSALESNANFKDGRLVELFRNSGLVEMKSLGEFKNFLQACENKKPSKQG